MASSARRVRNIDAQIGVRIRAARQAQGMSQMMLANGLGVTFQQVQKYENGRNRISAGRLFDVAHVLGMPITYFYEGAKRQTRLARRSSASASAARTSPDSA